MRTIETESASVFTVQEAAQLTGLSEHTLRYYERVGLISAVRRDHSSRHRQYSSDDIARLEALSCMRALGMRLVDMRAYLATATQGRKASRQMVKILERQHARLQERLEETSRYMEYTKLKLAYWRAVESRDDRASAAIAARLRERLRPRRKLG